MDYPDSAEDLIGPQARCEYAERYSFHKLLVGLITVFPMLKASVEYHSSDDKKAGMAGGKQKELERGTNEYLFGIEWDVIKRLTISGGAQITDYGLSDNQSDVGFSCDSYSLGFWEPR